VLATPMNRSSTMEHLRSMKFMQRRQEAQRRLELQSIVQPSSSVSDLNASPHSASETVTILEARPVINHMMGRRQFGVVVRSVPVAPAFTHPLSAGLPNDGELAVPRRDEDRRLGVGEGPAEDLWGDEREQQGSRAKGTSTRRRSDAEGTHGGRFYPDEAVERQPPMPKGLEREMKRRRKEVASRRDDDDDFDTAGALERF
jgi:hypothetical protein